MVIFVLNLSMFDSIFSPVLIIECQKTLHWDEKNGFLSWKYESPLYYWLLVDLSALIFTSIVRK
jgi:hypothetical protein